MASRAEAVRHAVATLNPGYFALVMGTGIISVAMRNHNLTAWSAVMMWIAVVAWLILLGLTAWRATGYRAAFLADFTDPARGFGFFTFVAATDVVGNRLVLDGHRDVAFGLLVVGWISWLVLGYVVPWTAVLGREQRPVVAAANGTWFIWVVASQSAAVLAAALEPTVPSLRRELALVAVFSWSLGVFLYAAAGIFVAARLMLYPIRPIDLTPPYWVAMGATAITVLAGARIVQMSDAPMVNATRGLVAGASVVFWAFGTWLIPPLVAAGWWRHITHRVPLRYEATWWSVVFPLGMYAVAGHYIGTADHLPIVRVIGEDEAWVALAVWALSFLAMLRHLWRTLIVVVTAAGLAGCAAGTHNAGWHSAATPARGARIEVLAPISGGLLALGSVPGPQGRAPAAWTTTDAQHWRAVPLTPTTYYGGQAEFAMAGVAGGRINAYGLAYGGAHGNPRPSVWTGTTAGLVEHEQPFEMFGGPHAISVNDETARAGTALIAGSWDGASGRYGAAVWTSADGARWTRNADDPALASAPGEQTSAHGAANGPQGFVVVGDTMHGGSTHALAWTSADGRSWQRHELAYPQRPATAAHVGCDASGCVVVGNTADAQPSLLCWGLRADGAVTAAGPRGPGGGLVEPDQVLLQGATAYAVVSIDGTARLVSVHRDCTHWSTVKAPVASRDAAVGQLGGRLLLATTDDTASRLWLK